MLRFRLRRKENGINRELTYASHHHLIPLYALCGTAIVGVMVVACYVTVLWQNDRVNTLRPLVNASIADVENQYVPAAISPADKKQYVYPANIRFALTSPYNALRYSYDPGMAGTSTSATIGLTTSNFLQTLEAPMLKDPVHVVSYLQSLQSCNKLYVIRFQPGVTPYGGFTPLKDIKLKDGRTAYIHKNTGCVPDSTQAMDNLDDIEAAVTSVESY